MTGNYFFSNSADDTGYQIEQSLLFSATSYLSLGTGTTYTTTNYTISLWIKSDVGAAGTEPNIFNTPGNNFSETCIKNAYNWNATGTHKFGSYWHQTNTGNNYDGGITTGVYSDPGAWYHVVIAIDTTQAAAIDRCKYFVNGELQAITVGSNPIPQNYSPVFRNFEHRIGNSNMYIAEYHLTTDGTKAATDFGEYDSQGVWRPIEYTGSYGTFGFYLKFDPSATNGIGHDHSGNGFHWTPTTYLNSSDIYADTPTANHAIFNRLAYVLDTPSLSSGGLSLLSNSITTGHAHYAPATIPVSSGKWYAEFLIGASSTGAHFGAVPLNNTFESGYLGSGPGNGSAYSMNGSAFNYNNSGSIESSLTTATTGDYIGVALDLDDPTGKLYIYKNGVQITTAQSDNSFTTYNLLDYSPTWTIAVGNNANWLVTANFGQDSFVYNPPSADYKPLSTANLPTPLIKDPSEHHITVLDTGSNILSSAQSAFTNGLWWIKDRDSNNYHYLVNSINGTSDAWRLPLQANGNYSAPFSANNAVAWCWNLLANRYNGFDIVNYTGNGTTQNISHSLGYPPDVIITKSAAVYTAAAYFSSLGQLIYLRPFTSATSKITSNTAWNNLAPTSSVFSVGSNTITNDNTAQYTAYLWRSVPGYSKIGSGESYSNSDNVFVYTGFKVAWLLITKPDVASSPLVFDAKREPNNPAEIYLNTASTASDTTSSVLNVDLLSNGFKLRGTYWNSERFVYMAFAEHPLGGQGTSPTTAR